MHCVRRGIPTGKENLELNQIDVLKQRYAGAPIGFSTHEHPDNVAAIQIAVGKGAVVFERHVGVKTEQYAVNAYSSTPSKSTDGCRPLRKPWICAARRTTGREFSQKELSDLRGLRRRRLRQRGSEERREDRTFKYFLRNPQCRRSTSRQRHVEVPLNLSQTGI